MTDVDHFARLVLLACHDLRTPLATVHGFALTLSRSGDLGEPAARYVSMIEQASEQIGQLLDELGLAARIESGRYEPARQPADTLELARDTAERLGPERVGVSGEGGAVAVDVEATRRAVAALARCALRHGGLERVELTARGDAIEIAPITPAAAPVVLGEDLRDLGAAVAARLVGVHGGSLELADDRLHVRLPA